MRYFLFIALTVLTLLACSKEDPFQQERNRLQGVWLLTEITGGIAGTGYEADFTHLEMTSQDRYALLAEETPVQEGDYNLTTENGQLVIRFTPDVADNRPFDEFEKTVIFSEEDRKLVLSEPCCDLFVYHFEREGE